jgi:GNAT superfamily N-acetyltransferase
VAPSVDPSLVRRLGPADLPALLALQEVVGASAPEGYLWPKPERDLRAYLSGARGAAYGIAAGDTLLALGLLRIPDRGHPNGGPRFRLVPEHDWALHACFLEHTMVRPPARGRGCQRALVEVRLAHARSRGLRWACGGVRIGNRASWANLLAKGLVIADMRCDLGEPMLGLLGSLDGPAPASDPADRLSVAAGDAALHRAALRDGYIGVRLAPDGSVAYQRLLGRAERAA